jgi:hypothetical protein
MRVRILGIAMLLVCVALVGGSAQADAITVQNGSFETSNTLTVNCAVGCNYNTGPVPGWVTTGVEAGSWQPGSTGVYFNAGAVPDGSTIAYVVDGSLSQDLGVGLQPDSTYALSVDVGDRLDGFMSGAYTIALDVNGVSMCSFTGNNTSITPGTFSAETCSFGTGSTVPSGDLSVVLSDTSGQATFDNVTVVDPVDTPEPSSAALLGFGLCFVALFGAFHKRKDTIASVAS